MVTGKRTTFVGGLTLDGFIAPMIIEQAMNAATFEAWVEQFLVPDMPGNAIVVMNNLSAHKGLRVRELIEAAGGEVLYLPSYSPDLNPPLSDAAHRLPSNDRASILKPQMLAKNGTGDNHSSSVARVGPVTELFRFFDLVFCHKGETSWHRNQPRSSAQRQCG